MERVWQVEIDEKVIELSQKYLPAISKDAFKNKKAEIIIGDGKNFMRKYSNFFDVIILDLSDPAGPAKELISLNFYKDVKRAMRKEGIVSIQSGSLTYQPSLVGAIYKRVRKIFPSVEIRKSVVPVYNAGEFSFTVASGTNLSKISPTDIKRRINKLKLCLRYLDSEVMFATKVLPNSLKKILV